MTRCTVVLVLHIDRGEIDGVDVGDLSVGFIADTPAVMSEGGWRLGLVLDRAASPEQLDGLRRFMTGEFGGVPAALGPLIGELLGEVVEPIEFRDETDRHMLRIGDGTDVTVVDVTSPDHGAVELRNVAHPVNTTLTVGEGAGSRVSLLGIEYSGSARPSSQHRSNGRREPRRAGRCCRRYTKPTPRAGRQHGVLHPGCGPRRCRRGPEAVRVPIRQSRPRITTQRVLYRRVDGIPKRRGGPFGVSSQRRPSGDPMSGSLPEHAGRRVPNADSGAHCRGHVI
jgi:hypothetical protein